MIKGGCEVMRRRLVVRSAVAALVVAAGCRGGGDDGQVAREEADAGADIKAVTVKGSSLTLSEPVEVAAKGRSAPSVVAADRSGDVYLAWVEDGLAGLRVVVARSEDGGRRAELLGTGYG